MHNTHFYPRILLSLVSCCLVILFAACSSSTGSATPTPGTTPTSSGTTATVDHTPTTAPPATVPPTQTNCPAAGTARAAVVPSLALGSHPNIVYIVNESQGSNPTFGTLKSYDVTTGSKTEIVKMPNVSLSEAQLSADGQWTLFVTIAGNQAKLQLIRVDGKALQTLYCAKAASNGAYPPSALDHVQWSSNEKLVVFNSYTDAGSALYLLNMQSGSLQTELSTTRGVLDTAFTWLDNTRVYLLGPMIDGPPTALYLLDTSRGANQNSSSLLQVFLAGNAEFCWNADSSYDSAHLFISQCTTDPSTTGPGISDQRGPSSVNIRPATGGSAQTIFSNQAMAVTAVRAISKTTLLLLVENNGFGSTNVDTSKNGLWKINTDGTGLTRLTSDGAGVSGGPSLLCQYTQYPWSNASRDGSLFALQHNSSNGKTISLLFGSLNGGTPTTFASISDGTQLAIVGWTTL